MRFNLDFQDYMSAQRLHAKRAIWPRVSFFLSWWSNPVVGLCLLGEAFFLWYKHGFNSALIILFIAGVGFICWPYYLRMRYKALYRKTRKGNTDTELTFNEYRFLAVIPDFAKSEYSWNAVRSWRESDQVLMIYIAPALFVAIPKRALSEPQLHDLRALLRSKVTAVAT